MKVLDVATLYNVMIFKQGTKDGEEKNEVLRLQFYASDIIGAINQASEHGEVVKVTHAMWDNESHMY